jgi:2,4-dienoyl-CoA reductase-like NADH-dependent reductase (Old Yellow Enzyme family)
MHQAYHVGGHGDQDNSWEPYWSPSGVPSFHDQWGSHAMTEAEIEELIAAFVAAARRDRDSGFDGTDLFAGYNCLIDQFWSPLTNKRDDKWGGSFENRVRFSVEICRRIRATCGDRFIIGMTISGAEPYPGGLTIADKQEIIVHLDSRGLVDYFSCGTGSYLNQFSKIVPSFHYGMFLGTDDAAKFKEVVKHARVTAEARVKTPENAEKVIAEGKADMVSIVRGQIADPHLANKAKGGQDIRPCISLQPALPRPPARLLGVLHLQPLRSHESSGTAFPPPPQAASCAGGRRRPGRPRSGARHRPASRDTVERRPVAASSVSPPASPSAARSARSCTGIAVSSRSFRSRSSCGPR